ncbi:PP2C family protein-serine/threonine phosphatase [Algoriphagus yeomjeoni]|uniref:PAS domain S-box-containing protein n=1 Tax=Algoriphagus yeomjeoni TaxID=291403 RepID=A0A327PJN5_9BACT|nr:PP2C family protein-serine/threonine phosphatase [Algoriphagus yeomjeoni]RAI91422.1 PAS domain S-box-containing protein [Algoriphagus yeomjeoni]
MSPKEIVSSYKEFEDLLIKATNTANEGITISSMDQIDRPLVFVNEGFERLTGYSKDDVIGKNCRFLQGEETDQTTVDILRRAIKKGEQATVELLNYKKDGTAFWNRLSITPLKDKNGVTTHYVGVQSDITELRETQKNLKSANKELALFQDKINFELEEARRVQNFILPSILPSTNKLSFASVFEPMDQIGGDFYDILEIEKGIFGVLIADVTGHGIQAALLTFMTSFAFKNIALQTSSTAKVVTETNEKLYNKMPRGSFITMFYAVYDSNTQLLKYTQAGHPEGYVIRANTREVIPLTSLSPLVGAFSKETVSYSESIVKLETGDKVLLYTDAILEVWDSEDVMMKREEFTTFLIKNSKLPIDELLKDIKLFCLKFSGQSSFNDDFTMVGFEVLS